MIYFFGDLLKKDINANLETWNNHRIRRGQNTNSQLRPSGIPYVIYNAPDVLEANVNDYKHAVIPLKIDVVNEICCTDIENNYLCSVEFYTLANIIMSENSYLPPIDCNEALILFNDLLEKIGQI